MAAPRKIDYAEAARLRNLGWSYEAVAKVFGVTHQAVRFALDDDAYARAIENTRRFQKRHFRVPCAQCGRIRVVNIYQADQRTGLCMSCFSKEKLAKRLTDTHAHCSRCGEWKPHDSYTLKRGIPRTVCRTCDTEAKRDWARRNPAKYQTANWASARRRKRAA